MADNTQTTVISLQIDEQAKAKLVKGLQEVQAQQKRVAVESLALGRSAEETAKEIQGLVKQERDLKVVLDTIDRDLLQQADSFKKAADSADDYESRLKGVQAGGANLSGDIASSLGGIRGAAGAVGLGGTVGAPLEIAQAAADLGEFLPKLKVGLEAVSASGNGVISTVSGLAAGVLPAAGAGFGAIAIALAPIIAVGALAAGAIALVSSELDKAAKAAAKQAENQAEANRTVNELIGIGTTTGDALQNTVQQAQAIDIAFRNLEDAQNEYDAYLQQRGNNALQALGDAVNLYGDEEQALADEVKRTQDEFSRLTTIYDETNQAIQAGEFAANDLAAAETELAQTREEESQRAIAEAEAANARVAQLTEQRNNLLESRAIAEANANEVESLERSFARKDEKKEFSAHLADLQAIREKGYENEVALANEIKDLPNQQAIELAKVNQKGTEQLNKLNGDYFQNQIKATKNFAKESERINQEVAKNARRIAEDLADTLSNAARDNDVVAFLEAQRNGQKELKRNAEDAKGAEKERQEDFLQQQEEQRQAYEQRHQEITQQLNQERAQVAQSFNEKRQALEQEILNERNATQQSIANAKARYAQDEAQEDLQASRTAQRIALRESHENAAFQRTISGIDAKVNAELAGLQRVASAAMSLGSTMSKTVSFGKSPSSTYVSPYANIPTGSSGGFSKSAQGGGITVNVSNNNNVGDVASQTQLNAVANQIVQNAQSSILKAVQIAQGG